MHASADQIIAQFGLQPLPGEGGFFRVAWVSAAQLPGGRAASSAIWFLLTADNFSAWHRLRAEELWHFHAGDPVEHLQLDPRAGTLRIAALGPDLLSGELPRLAVGGGVWQAARLKPAPLAFGWALLGCTVTPAWEEAEFELGSRAALLREFPAAEEWIRGLTR